MAAIYALWKFSIIEQDVSYTSSTSVHKYTRQKPIEGEGPSSEIFRGRGVWAELKDISDAILLPNCLTHFYQSITFGKNILMFLLLKQLVIWLKVRNLLHFDALLIYSL